jgi:hypothetical protein
MLQQPYIEEAARYYGKSVEYMAQRHAYLTEKLEEQGDCLVYPGYTNKHGYALVGIGESARTYIHRLFLLVAEGLPPTDDHFCVRTCDERACCNSDHLYWSKDHLERRGSTGGATTKRRFEDRTIRRIRELYATKDVTQEQLGQEYGVSAQSISRIINFRTYKDVK